MSVRLEMFQSMSGVRRPARGPLYVLTLAVLLAASLAPLSAQDSDTQERDARLDQKITLDLGKVKLMDACAKITEMTGVVVKAGESDREWRVRERLVTIEATNMQLGALTTELSRLLGFRLSRAGKDGQFNYLYWQDRNSKNLEADLLNSQNAEAAARATQMRESTLTAARDALTMTEAEALAQKEKNPWLAYLGGTKAGRGFSKLLVAIEKSAPIERDLILRGKRATIELRNLPPAATGYSTDMVDGGFVAAEVRKQNQQAAFKDIVPRRVTVLGSEMLGDQAAGIVGLAGMMIVLGEKSTAPADKPAPGPGMSPFGEGVPMAVMPLARPESVMGKAFGKMLFAIDAGSSMEDANKQLMAEFSDPAMLSDAIARPSQSEKTPPPDPRWNREIELGELPAKLDMEQIFTGKGGAEGNAFGVISKALGMPVLAESFRNMMPVSVFLKPGKQPAYRVLIALEKAGYIWEMDAQALRVRPSDWALQRANEIPESFITHYRQLLAKQEELTFDQIAGITADLTDQQIQNNLIADPELSAALATALSNPFGSRDALRLYGALTAAQKATMTSEAGLPFSSLDQKQWELMSGILADYAGGVEVADGTVRLELSDPLKGNKDSIPAIGRINLAQFKIEVFAPGEEKPRDIQIQVMYPSKEQIKAIRDAQKSARETMEKAAKDREKQKQPPPPNK